MIDIRDLLPISLRDELNTTFTVKDKKTEFTISTEFIALSVRHLQKLSSVDGDSCQLLAMIYSQGLLGYQIDGDTALQYMKTGAKLGNASCQFMLAQYYQQLLPFQKVESDQFDEFSIAESVNFFEVPDSSEARKWYTLAAKQGCERSRVALLGLK